MSESKQWMSGEDYKDALENYISHLTYDIMEDMLFDYIFEDMARNLTNEQIQQFIDTGEW